VLSDSPLRRGNTRELGANPYIFLFYYSFVLTAVFISDFCFNFKINGYPNKE